MRDSGGFGLPHIGPVLLLAALLSLLGALIYDLSRAPRPVSEARFDWSIPEPKLPWLGPVPAAAPRREVPAIVIMELQHRPHPRHPRHPDDGPPPLGSAPDLTLPLPARPPDPALLAHARALLGARARSSSLGPYSLLTDVEDAALLASLARVANAIEGAYRERTTLTPVGAAAEAIILFAERADYDAFIDGEARLAGLRPAGHTSRGLVALAAGERSASDVAATLVHELTHLLNRRALGPALPPWLDEGLAEDFAASALDAAGRPVLSSFGGEVTRAGGVITYDGGRAALLNGRRALAAAEAAVGLERLTAMDWDGFVRTPDTYSYSLFCIRTLLDGDEPQAQAAFRDFLNDIAHGGSADAESLRGRLRWSWPEWNARLAAWAARRASDIATEIGVAESGG